MLFDFWLCVAITESAYEKYHAGKPRVCDIVVHNKHRSLKVQCTCHSANIHEKIDMTVQPENGVRNHESKRWPLVHMFSYTGGEIHEKKNRVGISIICLQYTYTQTKVKFWKLQWDECTPKSVPSGASKAEGAVSMLAWGKCDKTLALVMWLRHRTFMGEYFQA